MNTRNSNTMPIRSRLSVLIGAVLPLIVGQAVSAPLFGPPANFGVSTRPHWVSIGDLNQDGSPDLAVANAWGGGQGSVSLLFGNGDGSFHRGTDILLNPSRSPKVVKPADLNDDGALDLVTANQESQDLSVLIGNGNGTFRPSVTYPTSIRKPHGVDVGDINRDGKLDIAVVGWGGDQVGVKLARGDGTFFGAEALYVIGTQSFAVVIEDLNRDGYNDLAVANHGSKDISVLLNNRAGGFFPQVRYSMDGGPHSVRAADLDRDGDLDLVSANDWSNNASVRLGNGDGTFGARINYTTGRTPKSVFIADFNGDGKLDLITANANGNYPNYVNPGIGNSVSVLLGVGDGKFLAKTDYPVGPGPFSVVAADLNCDGAPDFAAANYWGLNISVGLNVLGSQVPCGWSVPGP